MASDRIKLYTCGQREHAARLMHPCGVAGTALRAAGYEVEIATVGGYRLLPWTRRGQRDEIRELSGQEDVPVAVLPDGEVIAGSGAIKRWAQANPASAG